MLSPWLLSTSRAFWEGFSPSALTEQHPEDQIRTVFRVESDWSRATAKITQRGDLAHISVSGGGDLEAAGIQVGRFLSLDVDGRGWPDVARRDTVIADAQRQLPGLRPCGFHSPCVAAPWSVLFQRTRITQAARLRNDLVDRHGDGGAFPAPQRPRDLDLDLPGRTTEYLHAVADAALEGQLDGATLRALDPDEAVRTVHQIKGLGPFAAELVVLRGANAPDILPRHERRLDTILNKRYPGNQPPAEVAEEWRLYRT